MTAAAEITWADALANYRAAEKALAIAADLSPDDPWYVAAIDAWCDALDALVERTPAPDMAALATKIHIAEDRTQGEPLLDDHWSAIKADIARLAAAA